MKHFGSKMEYSDERVADLMRTYDRHIAECAQIRMPDIYKAVVESPAKRFWVSDMRASVVVAAMMRGERKHLRMRPLKREMFVEIYRRVLELRQQHPDWTTSALCAEVVTQPAPRFYLSAGSAKLIICKARKKWREEKLKRLRLYGCL